MSAIPDWSNFLVAETGAAAALTGLIFVAVSINLAKILEYPGVASRAGEALALQVGVLLLGTFGLAPNQPQKILGCEFLFVGGTLWLLVIFSHVRQIRRYDHPWWWLASRAFLCQGATLPTCVAGISLFLGHPSGMYWLVPACVFSFLASVTSGWVLLVEIVR